MGDHLVDDLAGGVLQLVDPPGDLLVLDGVVEAAHFLDGPVLLQDQSVNLGVPGGGRFLWGLLLGRLCFGGGLLFGRGLRFLLGGIGELILHRGEDPLATIKTTAERRITVT